MDPIYLVLALLSCPCHLPFWVPLLAGNAGGALLGEHLVLASALMLMLLIVFAAAAWRRLGPIE